MSDEIAVDDVFFQRGFFQGGEQVPEPDANLFLSARLVEGQPVEGPFPGDGGLDQTLVPPSPPDGLPLIRLS